MITEREQQLIAVPEHGWTCFHCGETFITHGEARQHFGFDPNSDPACRIKTGEERGLVRSLRAVERKYRDPGASSRFPSMSTFRFATEVSMAEHEAGTPCPGCTAEKITAKMAANPLHDFHACRQCLERGAQAYAIANEKRQVREDETHAAGRASGIANGEAHGQG